MARPKKNNADYFPHDSGMRNDPRIKAVRRKFGLEGYAVWAMLLETLTDADFFEIKSDIVSIEIMAGDFEIDSDKLIAIIEYLQFIGLLQSDSENKTIYSKRHKDNFSALLSKRKRDRGRVIDSENYETDSENPQRKGKNNKEKYSDKLKTFVGKYIDYVSKTFPAKAPKRKNIKSQSLDTIEKLIRIDGFEDEYIFSALRWAKDDDFWCTQIYSLAGLRKRSKNGLTKFQNLASSYDATKQVGRETKNKYNDNYEDISYYVD